MNERIKEFLRNLTFHIRFERDKELSGEWTEEYREGFVDGLKRAKELFKEEF